jgi:hypothetical protein
MTNRASKLKRGLSYSHPCDFAELEKRRHMRREVYNTQYYVRLVLKVIPILVWISLSGVVIGFLEGWNPLDSFYATMVQVPVVHIAYRI